MKRRTARLMHSQTWMLWLLLGSVALGGIESCSTTEAEPSADPARGLRVNVRGRLVMPATAGAPARPDAGAQDAVDDFSAVTVQVFRVGKAGAKAAHTEKAKANAQGQFELAGVPLKPWEDTYEISIDDPSARYQSRSLALFVLAGDTVDYGNIEMTRMQGEARTEVSGIVMGAAAGNVLAGTKVSLVADTDSPVASAVTEKDGTFRLEAVEVRGYRMKLDIAGYVTEERSVSLNASAQTALGHLFMAPERQGLDLSFVLTGARNKTCEESFEKSRSKGATGKPGFSHLRIPPKNFNINSAYGYEVKRWGSSGIMAPAGFGYGTPFWPPFFGARATGDATGSTIAAYTFFGMNHDAATGIEKYEVNGRMVAESSIINFEERRVETTIVQQISPLESYPTQLAYYYERSGGQKRYPMGTMLYSVETECLPEAEVAVYREKESLGRFRATTSEARQIGEFTEWSPVLIEYGYTTSNPTKDDDLYIDVIPVSAIDITQEAEPQAYVRPSGHPNPKQGWKTPPVDLTLSTGGESQAYFAGKDASGKPGIWVLTGTPRLVSAAQDSQVGAGVEFLAMTSVRRSAKFDSLLIAYQDQGAFKIREGRFDDAKAPGDYTYSGAKPVSIGVVQGATIIGTVAGLTLCDACNVDAPAVQKWLINLITSAPATVTTHVRQYADQSGNAVVILGTEGKGAWYAAAAPPWGGWKSIEHARLGSTASVVNVIDYDNTLYIATAKDGVFYGLDSGRMTGAITIDSDGKMLPSQVLSAEEGKTVSLEIRGLAVFDDRLYIGTNAGIWQYDRKKTLDCGTPPSDACIAAGLRQMTGFPSIAVNSLVNAAGALYVSTNRGLFEISSP